MNNSVEREFLEKVKQNGQHCKVIMKNGYQMLGQIINQDDLSIVLIDIGNKSNKSLLYKTAISTIVPFG